MKSLAALACVLFLASCGADGEPVRPTAGATVKVTPSGVNTSGTVGVVKGPVTIAVGF